MITLIFIVILFLHCFLLCCVKQADVNDVWIRLRLDIITFPVVEQQSRCVMRMESWKKDVKENRGKTRKQGPKFSTSVNHIFSLFCRHSCSTIILLEMTIAVCNCSASGGAPWSSKNRHYPSEKAVNGAAEFVGPGVSSRGPIGRSGWTDCTGCSCPSHAGCSGHVNRCSCPRHAGCSGHVNRCSCPRHAGCSGHVNRCSCRSRAGCCRLSWCVSRALIGTYTCVRLLNHFDISVAQSVFVIGFLQSYSTLLGNYSLTPVGGECVASVVHDWLVVISHPNVVGNIERIDGKIMLFDCVHVAKIHCQVLIPVKSLMFMVET